jgi:uncharacterized protein
MVHFFYCRQTVYILFSLLYLAVSASCSTTGKNDFIDDRAGLLQPQEAAHLGELCRAMRQDFDVHFRLVTMAQSPADINLTAAEIFGDLGAKTRGAKGLLFLVDPQGRQVRIEVGYDLEPYFPDIFIGYLEKQQMLPFFQANRIGHGIEAAAELLISRLQLGIAGQEYDPDQELGALTYFSGGGGARLDIAPTATGRQTDSGEVAAQFVPQVSPEQTLALYKRVLAERIKDPGLMLYTEKTREFFSKWVVTDAQQANELQSLNAVVPDRVLTNDSLSVIRFPLSERTHPPYFFTKTEDGWQLDFYTMSRTIQMNHKNMWHFRHLDHQYAFAFTDWEFDRNGFPVRTRK